MKKIILFAILACISFCAFSQTVTNKGELNKKELKLNNGAIFNEGDTIQIGTPLNGIETFSYIYNQKRLFGLSGGDGVKRDKIQYRQLIIHYFYTQKNKENNEKEFMAALGDGNNNGESLYICDINNAVNTGEIIVPGIEITQVPVEQPQNTQIAENTKTIVPIAVPENIDKQKEELKAEKQRLEEEKERIEARKKELEKQEKEQLKQQEEAAKLKEKQAKEQQKQLQKEAKQKEQQAKDAAKKEEKQKVENTVISTTTSGSTLLDKINKLKTDKDLTDSEHYQLLKILTGSTDGIDKKGLIKKLQTLRNSSKISIADYDTIIEKLL